MTSHTGRLYALALALVVFFVLWATVAARWAVYRADLRARRSQIAAAQKASAAAAPAVRVVTLPPLTVTRTS
jgi:hypothetical protein